MWQCVHPTKSRVHIRRHTGSSCRCMHSVHDPTIEDARLEKIRRSLRLQLPLTHHRHHRIPHAHVRPSQPDHKLYLDGVSLYRPHADPSQLLPRIRYYTESATNHQQSKYTLWRHGRIDINRIQLQLEFERIGPELRQSYYDRPALRLPQKQSSQQSGKRVRHGPAETLQVKS